MMPTMCDIAGVESPETDGISMLPTFLGKHRKQKKHEFLFWEFPEYGGQKAVRMGKWKALVENVRKGNRKVQLFDLETDPREQNDISAQHPDVVKKALQIFRDEHTDPEIKTFNLPVW